MFEGLLQPMHLLVILVIAALFFGPKKLADLGKGLGDGIRGFKDAIRDQPAPAATQSAAPAATQTDSAPKTEVVQSAPKS